MNFLQQQMTRLLEAEPVIAAVKNEDQLEAAVKSDCRIVFLLCGDLCSIPSLVERVKSAGKLALVHIDLVAGLSAHEAAVRFLKQGTAADGIISTKAQMIKAARENDMIAVQRFFVLDSLALANITRQAGAAPADVIEVLPAVSPRIIARIAKTSPVPVIVGGLIDEKEDVIQMLAAGAIAISSTSPAIWSV